MKMAARVLGILCVIGGLYCIVAPGVTFLGIGWIVGLLFLLAGISSISSFFKKVKGATGWDFLTGVLSIVFAIVVMANQSAQFLTEMIILYLAAGWLIVCGIFRIMGARKLKNTGIANWLVMAIIGVIAIIMGFMIFIRPLSAAMAIGWVVGLFVIIQGLNLIGSSFNSDKAEK